VTLVGHSEGASIALRTAAHYAQQIRVRRVVLVNPANMYRDFLPWLALRITCMSLRDLLSRGGREYWFNSGEYFSNVWRSLREAWELCGESAASQTCVALAEAGVEVLVFQDRHDGVFSTRRTRRVANRYLTGYFPLNIRGRGRIRHDWPATHPNSMLVALKGQNAFD
jgi:pimeloyl-ACP methyl ester carboxylesterase